MKTRPFERLIPIEDAIGIVESKIKPIDRREKIPTDLAVYRILARDIEAHFDVPPFNRSAMDGYAVIAEDTFGAGQFDPKVLRIKGYVHAGEVTDVEIDRGECVEVATGARMPKNSDAVVVVESTEGEKDTVNIFEPVHPKENVSNAGGDIKEGEVILKDGELLDPGKIGVLASLGIGEIEVYEKPKIGILPTGDEVCPIGMPLKEGKVYDVNSHTVSALVRSNGGKANLYEIVGDRFEDAKRSIEKALENDIILLSGGSSVGERDILIDVINEIGEILFHGVQIKPGLPTLFGMIGDKPIFGMPGYPTSCLINAYVFLLPAMRKMARLPRKEYTRIKANISRRFVSTLGRTQFLTVKVQDGKAIPVFKESGAITSVSNSDGFIEIDYSVNLIEKGEEVLVNLWQ
ncbi:MAG: molybdopterin biosynthesis protein MoeA [Candidatus Methanolliviera sp. GoM_oil]|nr:MAG: molybdopterin biosynthesis protein MoeA [Candidatus Methanolliviera sp. GoM_oil]